MLDRHSLRTKTVAAASALCIICVGVFGGIAHFSLSSDARDEMVTNSVEAQVRAGDVIAKIEERIKTYASVYAEHPVIVDVLASGDKVRMEQAVVKLFEKLHSLDPVLGTLEITDGKGIVQMRGHEPAKRGDNKSAEPLVAQSLNGKAAQGFTVSTTSREISFDAVEPVLANGVRIGTIKVGARFRGDTAAEIKRLTGAEAIFAQGGKVLASTLPGVQLPSVVSDQKGGVTPIPHGASSYLAAATSLALTGGGTLQVLTLSDEAPSVAKLQNFELMLALKALAFVIIMLPVVLYLVNRNVRPLRELAIATERLAAGQLDTEIQHSQRRDEIGMVAQALGVFRENLRKVRALEAEERAAAERRLKAAESMASVVTNVGEVVAAAAAGDFSAQLQITDADEQMQKLVAGINEINAVVDSATTEFAQALQAVAGGDLTQRIDTAYRGRFADLKAAVNDTVDRLSQTVRTIQLTASDVGLAAREINMGADDLSKRTEEQASSLEETAATTEELAASVKASAQASREAAAIADEARQAAQAGGAIAGQAVEAMARIETASQKISAIIRVIDDIAFQTNLLALNAAVEAARAGDAGKGFAVVASEVRTLAQRSGEAAKDISALISSSNTEVGEGVKLVRQAGEALESILDASQKVAATIADISSASGEQANGIDEMSQAVAHLDEMTQQNAALAEESAASAGSLSGRIGQLNDLVAAFKTGHEGAALQAPAPLRAAVPARAAAPAPRQPASEPERLRTLAETAFTPARVPVKKVANSRAGDAGWEEF